MIAEQSPTNVNRCRDRFPWRRLNDCKATTDRSSEQQSLHLVLQRIVDMGPQDTLWQHQHPSSVCRVSFDNPEFAEWVGCCGPLGPDEFVAKAKHEVVAARSPAACRATRASTRADTDSVD